MDTIQTHCGITMRDCREIAPGLAYGRDFRPYGEPRHFSAPMLRVFRADLPADKGPFRGYVQTHHTPKLGRCYRIRVGGGEHVVKRNYKTLRGAETGLFKNALRLHAAGHL